MMNICIIQFFKGNIFDSEIKGLYVDQWLVLSGISILYLVIYNIYLIIIQSKDKFQN